MPSNCLVKTPYLTTRKPLFFKALRLYFSLARVFSSKKTTPR
nr:MAG TPA: hypothetical protein [Caudoviricetes sp.]